MSGLDTPPDAEPREQLVDEQLGEPAAPAPRVPIMAGTFALYEKPDGSMVLVTDIEGRGVETKPIPAAIVKMVQGGGGPLGATVRKLLGGE